MKYIIKAEFGSKTHYYDGVADDPIDRFSGVKEHAHRFSNQESAGRTLRYLAKGYPHFKLWEIVPIEQTELTAA